MNSKSKINPWRRCIPLLLGVLLSWCTAEAQTQITQLSYASYNQLMRDVDVHTNGWSFTAGSGQNSSPTTYDGRLITNDASLNLRWYVDFIGSGNDELNGVDVFSSGPYTGEVYVTGYFTGSMTMYRHDGFPIHDFVTNLGTVSSVGGGIDPTYFVSKFDLDGNLIWTYIADQSGQTNTDIGNDVSVVEVGTTRYVYTTGFWRGNTTFHGASGNVAVTADASYNDVFVASYIDQGSYADLQWVNKFGVAGKHDFGWAIQANATGDVYLTGNLGGGSNVTVQGIVGSPITLGFIGYEDAYLLKYDAAGAVKRGIVFGGNGAPTGSVADCGRGIALGASNRIIVSGYYTGNSAALGNAASQDAFLLGFIETGATNFNYAWKDFFRTSGADVLYRIATSQDQTKCIAVGSYTGTMASTYNGVVGGSLMPSNPGAPNGDSFLASVVSSSGAASSCDPLIGYLCDDDFDGLTGSAFLGNGTSFYCGNFRGWYFYDALSPPIGFQLSNYAAGSYETFLIKRTLPCKRDDISTVEPEMSEGAIQIFPNPSSAIFNVELKADSPVECSIYDLQGKLLVRSTLQVGQTKIDLSDRPAGIYLLQANDGKRMQSHRLVKQ